MPSRDRLPWLIDEYVVVGDLWLRRQRTVGTSDPEVKALAALLGRSPASISRRIGNFAGTDNPGTGLKPITGAPLEAWQRLRDDPSSLAKAVRDARARLAMLVEPDEAGVGASPDGQARFVPPEKPGTEPVAVVTTEQAKKAEQTEAVLREAFRSWRDPQGDRLQGIEIPVGSARLRVDLYDPVAQVLIEAKASAARDHLRLAVGQLYDYRRYLSIDVRLAVLVPEQPTDDLMGLLDAAGVGAIWPRGTSFVDSAAGRLLQVA